MQPIYEQIVNQIKSAIMCGELKEEELLPSVRTLAKELKMDLKEFGFDINSTKNDLKDDLIQMISKASDVELIFYKNMF